MLGLKTNNQKTSSKKTHTQNQPQKTHNKTSRNTKTSRQRRKLCKVHFRFPTNFHGISKFWTSLIVLQLSSQHLVPLSVFFPTFTSILFTHWRRESQSKGQLILITKYRSCMWHSCSGKHLACFTPAFLPPDFDVHERLYTNNREEKWLWDKEWKELLSAVNCSL